MDQPQTDYTATRNNMVDGQIRPNRVSDPRVLDALRTLPRELFVPPALAGFAYVDEDLPLGNGRVLMEPLIVARLVQMARVRDRRGGAGRRLGHRLRRGVDGGLRRQGHGAGGG